MLELLQLPRLQDGQGIADTLRHGDKNVSEAKKRKSRDDDSGGPDLSEERLERTGLDTTVSSRSENYNNHIITTLFTLWVFSRQINNNNNQIVKKDEAEKRKS